MASPNEELDNRKLAVARFLLKESRVHVYVDARGQGVRVPSEFRERADLVVAIGRELVPPIPDLVVSREGIEGTLPFGGRPHACRFPWPSIFALVDANQRGMIFDDSVPRDRPVTLPQQPLAPPFSPSGNRERF